MVSLFWRKIMENLPPFLMDILNKQYDKETTEKIIQGYLAKRKTTFRINTLKTDISVIFDKLDQAEIEYEKVSWSKEAVILKTTQEKEIQNLEMYEKGEIYLQSLSSMLPPIILNPKPNADILDMAAAPGGKTTQIAALTQNKAHITACEMNPVRAKRLMYNLEKQGANAYVMVSDSRKIDDFFSFDSILLDSPCSGTGTLHIKNENISQSFTMKLLEKSRKSQLSLLKKAITILKSKQEMVYSTCSILSSENEEIVEKILQETNSEIVPIEFAGMEVLPRLPVKLEGTLCICPDENYEGFFVAKIRKK